MDWTLFWTGGVVITLGSLIISCFRSLWKDIDAKLDVIREDISNIDRRLERMEGREEMSSSVLLQLVKDSTNKNKDIQK